MEPIDIEKLRYPIGHYEAPSTYSPELLRSWIADIKAFPTLIREAVAGLDASALQKTYRPGGWTIHQLVHHCADSHMNAFIRIKLALTEDNPTIKPYAEERWAELPDTLNLSAEIALNLLDGIHTKMAYLLEGLDSDALNRTFTHPQYMRTQTLAFTIGQYSWHGRHHLAHIGLALKG